MFASGVDDVINQLVSTAWATTATVGKHPKNIAAKTITFIADLPEHELVITNASLDLEWVRMKTPPQKLHGRCGQEELSKRDHHRQQGFVVPNLFFKKGIRVKRVL